MEGAKAAGIDISGAQVEELNAKKADLTGAIMQGVVGDGADFSDALMVGANLREAKMRQAIMERVDLRKAELEGAKLAEANLKGAKVEGATVDAASDLHGAEVDDRTIGNFKQMGADGKVEEISAEKLVKQHNEVHAAEQKSWLGKKFGNAMKSVGSVAQKIGAFFKQPMSEKWGRIIGAIAGTVIAGAIAVSAVATMGASLVVIGAIVAGAAVAGGVGGAVAGHYGAKKLIALHVIGAAAGFVAGPIGSAVGVAAAEGVERVSQAVTGHKASAIIGGGIERVGGIVEGVGNDFGVTAEVQKRMDERVQAEALHKAPVKPELNSDIDRSDAREHLKERAKQAEKGLVSDVSVVPSTKGIAKSPEELAMDIGKKSKKMELNRKKEGGVGASKSEEKEKVKKEVGPSRGA